MRFQVWWKQVAAALILVGAGVAAGYAIPHPPQDTNTQATRLGGYNFINPLLACDVREDVPSPVFSGLQQQFSQMIAEAKARGDITRASVYFRDMNGGDWTGINQNDLYIPASLLKVPLLIAYLREYENREISLDTQYTLPFGPDLNASEHFKPAKPLALGQSYTIEQLLEAMIEQSDNNAAILLNNKIATSSINQVYEDFGLPTAPDLTSESISPLEYMRVFRILYNATYLQRSDSQKALGMLSSIDFPEGAVRGIPATIPFANKFGERTVKTEDHSGTVISQDRQLADCGIVYYPKTPYGICIMVEGSDFTKLSNVIAGLSRAAYTAVTDGVLK